MLTEAAKGSDHARDTLFQLGLSMADLRKLSPEDQFTLIADRLSKVENTTRRAALAMEIFGRGGTELLPMLEGSTPAWPTGGQTRPRNTAWLCPPIPHKGH